LGAGNFGADLFFRSFVCEFLIEGETYGLDGDVGTSGGLEEGAGGLIVSKCCKLGQQDPGRRPRRGEELTGEFWLVRIHRHRCWVRSVCELFFLQEKGKKERKKKKWETNAIMRFGLNSSRIFGAAFWQSLWT